MSKLYGSQLSNIPLIHLYLHKHINKTQLSAFNWCEKYAAFKAFSLLETPIFSKVKKELNSIEQNAYNSRIYEYTKKKPVLHILNSLN